MLSASLVTANGPRGLHYAPGVLFLGFDNLWSVRSRYLRGIRADARWVADAVARFLASATTEWTAFSANALRGNGSRL